MSEWQPIDTLPDSGQFLVFMPEERNKFHVMVKHPNVTIIGNMFHFDTTKPTHWMPLPNPPQEQN